MQPVEERVLKLTIATVSQDQIISLLIRTGFTATAREIPKARMLADHTGDTVKEKVQLRVTNTLLLAYIDLHTSSERY